MKKKINEIEKLMLPLKQKDMKKIKGGTDGDTTTPHIVVMFTDGVPTRG